ncbi:MAG: hypothetical protein WCB20_07135 [Chthoniobacterales bacterium]
MKKLLYLGFVLCAGVALADETPPIELKHKSSFNMGADERNPFWPMGWKRAPKLAKNEHGPAIPPSAFVVSTIVLDPKNRYTIINGRIMGEGQQFGLQIGTTVHQITVKAIEDGHVVLVRGEQEIVVALRRK